MRRRHRRSTRPMVAAYSAPMGCVPMLANRPSDPRRFVVAAVPEGEAP
jgi:hypothetical protein